VNRRQRARPASGARAMNTDACHPRFIRIPLSLVLPTYEEIEMRKLLLAIALAFAATAAWADGVHNKWRLEFSGNAESDGRIELLVSPSRGEPVRVAAQVAEGVGENDVARIVRSALQAQAGRLYNVEDDDGEDVLVKKKDGERDFVITVVSNSVRGVRIGVDSE
jgi:hypothetical protein